MRIFLRTLLVLEFLGSVLIIYRSILPGALMDMVFPAILLFMGLIMLSPLLIILAPLGVKLWLSIKGCLKRPVANPPSLKREKLVLAVVPAITLLIVSTGIPQRIAINHSLGAFERAVAEIPVSLHGVNFDRRVGLYYVDMSANDPRGGVFFRLYAGADGIGPETLSYGIVKNPNREGSPFGKAGYSVRKIRGEWYWFSASNDF